MSWYREQLEQWLSELDVSANTVLDIGGAQGHVDRRVKNWNVKNYEVLDLPECDIAAYGIKKNEWIVERKDTADIIFCLEVFEYLINPTLAIENISYMLKQGGKAYITFAFIYPHHNELEFDSLRYTESGIKRFADEAGLKITNIWYRTDKSGLLNAFYNADGMRKAKQYDHHDVTGFIVEFTK